MSETLKKIKFLAQEGKIRISEHGYDELANDGLAAREVVSGISAAILVEDYPDYPKGPCVLVMQKDNNNKPVHVVWGIPKHHAQPAVLITAYRPDSELWDCKFLRR
ncbi:MAG TPA: DUF4258 domain-containing protein, partial [Sedimenticola sp.]|nr:DUF4258 domain-containing protein [Sedimenticola sp.]